MSVAVCVQKLGTSTSFFVQTERAITTFDFCGPFFPENAVVSVDFTQRAASNEKAALRRAVFGFDPGVEFECFDFACKKFLHLYFDLTCAITLIDLHEQKPRFLTRVFCFIYSSFDG